MYVHVTWKCVWLVHLCVYTSSELSVGMTTEGIDVRSVGNTLGLHETALIEGFNLKAAIEYQLKNSEWLITTKIKGHPPLPRTLHPHIC